MLAPMTTALPPRMTAQYSVLSRCMAGRWRTKSVEQSIADTDEPGTQLRKDLSWWHLAVFGVSVVIGAGIFTVTASTAGDITGPAIWISFLIAATTCGLAALCYAEFASMLPVAGSAYTFSYATFGEFLAWTIGWNLVLELAIGGAVVAKGWSSYLETVFGLTSSTIDLGSFRLDWGALLIVALVATLLALGTKLSSHFSIVVTTIKVSVVVLVIVVGAFYIKTANYSPFIPPAEADHAGTGIDQSLLSLLTGAHSSHYGWYGVLAGASIVFFAFIGFDIVATMAEETKHPQRDVPRGILFTLGLVTILYVGVSVVLSGMVPYTALKTTPGGHHANLATAFAINGVHWASGIISVGALAGLTTVVMVLLLGGCRVLFAMARDGLLPRQLARTGSRGTPVRITALVALLVAATASAFPTDKLEEMVNVGTLFAFLVVSAGVVVLRRLRPDLPRGFRAPLVPLLPVASVCACLWLMVNLTVITWVRFGVWMVAGIAIYLGYGRRHSVLASREAAAIEKDATLDPA
jgi:APA family basic amino acid/polyamine antiporter